MPVSPRRTDCPGVRRRAGAGRRVRGRTQGRIVTYDDDFEVVYLDNADLVAGVQRAVGAAGFPQPAADKNVGGLPVTTADDSACADHRARPRVRWRLLGAPYGSPQDHCG
jgi:hypothetical protein